MKNITRRDALKILGITTLTPLSFASSKEDQKTTKNPHIVIVGGGSGAIMVLARLKRELPHATITIIAPSETHIYQPGQIFVAAGLYSDDEIKKQNSNYIDNKIEWIKDEVKNFNPDKNNLITNSNKTSSTII